MQLVSTLSSRNAPEGDHGRAIIRSLYGPEPEHRARRLARETLASLGVTQGLGDVELAVCELVTNATKHAPPPYELRIFIAATSVKLAVADGGADYKAMAARLAHTRAVGEPSLEESGNGLVLITGLFPHACGVEPASPWARRPIAKQVWISTPRPAQPAPPPKPCP